jgi:ferric-dicitrate binding protein FerR (iron transport regulator)
MKLTREQRQEIRKRIAEASEDWSALDDELQQNYTDLAALLDALEPLTNLHPSRELGINHTRPANRGIGVRRSRCLDWTGTVGQ